MAKELSEQVEQESSPLSAELDAAIEAGEFGEEPAGVAEKPKAEETPAEETPVEEVPAEEETVAEIKAKAAAEVLEDTKDPDAVPLATFLKLKNETKAEINNLKGQIQATQAMKTEPAKIVVQPKSPLDLAEAAYIEENGNLDGFAMSGGLYRQQEAFNAKQAESAKTTTAQNDINQSFRTAAITMTAEKMGAGLDYGTIVTLGGNLLRPGDEINVKAAADPGEALYNESLAAIQRSGSDEQKASIQLLLNAQKTKATAVPKPKPKLKPKAKVPLSQQLDEDAEAEQGDDIAATGSNKRLAEFAAAAE